VRKEYEDHIQRAREEDEKFNQEILSNDDHCQNPFGFRYYTRPMVQHQGGKNQTDYFLNENRERIEQNVMRFVNG